MQIIPLILPEITKTPSSPDGGFVKLFASQGWLKLLGADKQLRDAVLDRTLQGIKLNLSGEIRETDTVLEALAKVRSALHLRPVDDDAEFRIVHGGYPDKRFYHFDKPDQTKVLQVQHRQGITRFWEYFGDSAVLQPGEWGVEYWPSQDQVDQFESHIREHYDPDYSAPALTAEERSLQGRVKSVRMGTGKSWNQTDFRLFSHSQDEEVTLYDEDFNGHRNSGNRVLTLSRPFVPGTTRVYRNGARLRPGPEHDYVEQGVYQLQFFHPIDADETFLMDCRSPK
jgi:hypothetical protein